MTATSRVSRSERPVCTGGEPPTCCQPPLTEAELAARAERIDALMAEIRARMPRHCPDCGGKIAPLWRQGAPVWQCDDCRCVMSGRGD
jgi:hypothetical protein